MADNTTLPSGAGGDTVRTIDRAGIKTQVIALDVGGETGPESLVSQANGLPITQATGITFAIKPDGVSWTQTGTSANINVTNFPATQPISVAALPLPANAAQETGGNLDTIRTLEGDRTALLSRVNIASAINAQLAIAQQALQLGGFVPIEVPSFLLGY